MKKVVLLGATALSMMVFAILLSVMLVSCEGYSKIWDSATAAGVWMTVENAAGDNLLDPQVEGNILSDGVYADYKGEKYPLQTTQTRALPPPKWYGLVLYDLVHSTSTSPPEMMFGEFDVEENFRGETFTINWGDGTTTEIKFDLYVKGNKRKLVRHLWIDGKLVNDNSLTAKIVK